MEGYSQSPKPYIDDVNFENLKNKKKSDLAKMKKNLEIKLKNIVTESKKHG